MNLYSIEMKICATAYIKAKSADEAIEIAKSLANLCPDIADHSGDVPISGGALSDPCLPDVSLSPAMTIHGPWGKHVELIAENIPEPRYRETFFTRTDQYRERNGQRFEVLRKITPWNMTDADREEYDTEVLPMYRIRFEDGHETSAFPEEIEAD